MQPGTEEEEEEEEEEQKKQAGATGGLWVWDLMMHPPIWVCVQQASFPCLLSQTTQKVLSLVPRKLKIQGISEDSTMSGLSESGL